MHSKKKRVSAYLLLLIFFSAIFLFVIFRERSKAQLLSLEQQYSHLSEALIKEITYPIPDLEKTPTIDAKTKKKTLGNKMVPQGLAFSDRLLFISAYSSENKYHSVIYVLEKATGFHKKTVVLPDLAHVGGLAYDPISENLWLTNETKDGKAQLAAYSMEQIEADDFKKKGKALAYQHEIPLNDLSKASFLAYYDSNLVVGHFKKENEGTLVSYPLDNHGLPRQAKHSQPDEIRSTDSKKEKVEIIEKLQGVSFYNNQILFSQSYGTTPSQLFFIKNNLEKDPTAYKESDFTTKIDFPPYMEQIVAADDKLYVLFESAALDYRHKLNALAIDSVLVFDLKKLTSNN